MEPAIEASRLRDLAARFQTYIIQRGERDASNALHNAEGMLHEYTVHLTELGAALSRLSQVAESTSHLKRFQALQNAFPRRQSFYTQLKARYHCIDVEYLEERQHSHFDLAALDEAFDSSPLEHTPVRTLMRRLQALQQRTEVAVQDPRRRYEVEDLLQEGQVLMDELRETLKWLEKNVLGLEDAQERSVRRRRWDRAIMRAGGPERTFAEDVALASGSSRESLRNSVDAETAGGIPKAADPRQEHEEILAFISSLPSPDLRPFFAYRAPITDKGRAKGKDKAVSEGDNGKEQAAEEDTQEDEPAPQERRAIREEAKEEDRIVVLGSNETKQAAEGDVEEKQPTAQGAEASREKGAGDEEYLAERSQLMEGDVQAEHPEPKPEAKEKETMATTDSGLSPEESSPRGRDASKEEEKDEEEHLPEGSRVVESDAEADATQPEPEEPSGFEVGDGEEHLAETNQVVEADAGAEKPEAEPKQQKGDTMAKADSDPSSEDSWYDCSSSRSKGSSDSNSHSSAHSRSPPRFSLHTEGSSRRSPSQRTFKMSPGGEPEA